MVLNSNTWQVAKEQTKYYTDWQCSIYSRRHNNDVIFTKISLCAQLNFVQNLYFRFFIFWKSTELCRFVTHLCHDPRTCSTTTIISGITALQSQAPHILTPTPWTFNTFVKPNIVEEPILLTPPTFVKLPWTLAPPSEWRYWHISACVRSIVA